MDIAHLPLAQIVPGEIARAEDRDFSIFRIVKVLLDCFVRTIASPTMT